MDRLFCVLEVVAKFCLNRGGSCGASCKSDSIIVQCRKIDHAQLGKGVPYCGILIRS